MPTPLERALEDPAHAGATPLDALRLAREHWLRSGRLDMGVLARELGVSRATLYRWVGTKERLIGEVLWTFAETAMADARKKASGNGARYLADATERYMQAALGFAPLMRFIAQDPEYALKVLASKHSPMQRRSIAATRDLLLEQVDRGKLRPALAPDELAFLIVRIVESYLYSDIITGREPDVDGAVRAIHALLLAPPVRRAKRRAPRAAAGRRSTQPARAA
jgi:AcrR family transcriptional regulator